MRIAFFGLPLAALLLRGDGHEIVLAVLSPVEAPGRRRIARRADGPVFDALGMGSDALEQAVDAALRDARPDLIVSWYWTRLLPAGWLARARQGGIGVHPSLLPRHRGPNPFYWAIDSGDVVTGVTVHRLTERYDEGDMLARESLDVGDRNAWQLARALDRPSLRQLRGVVGALSRGPLASEPQDPARITWAPEPEGDGLRLDFGWSTRRMLRRIRALSPVPGLPLSIRGVDVVVTGACAATSFPSVLHAGEVARTEEGVVLRTQDGAVLFTRGSVDEGGDDDDLRSLDGPGLAASVFGLRLLEH